MGLSELIQTPCLDTDRLKAVIEDSLLFDWIIRIECGCSRFESSCWQQWGEPFFAIRSADAVIDVLTECLARYPDRSIRLNAQKIQPDTKILYTVYKPSLLDLYADNPVEIAHNNNATHTEKAVY